MVNKIRGFGPRKRPHPLIVHLKYQRYLGVAKNTLNGYELQYTQTELSDTILSVAAGKIDATDILKWIIAHQ